jgi:hypothetical protein
MSKLLDTELARVIVLGRLDPKPVVNLALKLTEEVGELAEHVNHRDGYLPHKVMKEALVGEVCDVVQCAIAILAKVHPDYTVTELLGYFANNLQFKNNKWADATRIYNDKALALQRQPKDTD